MPSDEERLREYLERIRSIAQLYEDEALDATAGLVNDIIHVEGELDAARSELEVIRREAHRILDAIAKGTESPRGWPLFDRIDHLTERLSPDAHEQLAGDIKEISLLVQQVNEASRLQYCTFSIKGFLSEPILNLQFRQLRVKDIREVEKTVRELGRGEEFAAQLHEAKARVAWFRALKALMEAEIAEAGGSDRKATNLRAQAAVMLKQDWHEVLPDEQAPPLEAAPR